MKVEVKVGVSKKHVHLTEELWNALFPNKEMEKRNDLSQPGKFATTTTVNVSIFGKVIQDVRVVGPFCSYNQFEISNIEVGEDKSLPVRKSGDVFNSPSFTIMSENRQVECMEGTIKAQNHIHITPDLAEKYQLKEDEKIAFFTKSNERGYAYIKISNPAEFELHLDVEEALKYQLKNGESVYIEIEAGE